MPNTPFSQLERTWFSSRASVVSTSVPIDDLKRAYFSRGSLPSAGLKSLSQLESEWLGLITSGKIESGSSDLWQQAILKYTSITPSVIGNENEYLFYSLVTTSNLA